MKEKKVGNIKSIKFNEETGELEFTVQVTDNKFKKELLRNLSLAGNIKVVADQIMFVSKDDEDAKV